MAAWCSLVAAGLPAAVVGVAIAALVLMPEGLAAVRAARADRLQTSLNLALGSALATIGLTIPAVTVVSFALGLPLALGLGVLALLFFGWTLGNGQYDDPEGAASRILFDDSRENT